MKKAIFLMSGLFCSSFICAADDEAKPTFGDLTIDRVYNQAHHEVMLAGPDNWEIVSRGEHVKLAALFRVMEVSDASKLSKEEIKKKFWHIAKAGDHISFFAYTQKGFMLFKRNDNGTPTDPLELRESSTKDRIFDLLVSHVKSNVNGKKDEKKVFSLHPAGELEKKYSQAAARRSGSLVRLSMRKSSASASEK